MIAFDKLVEILPKRSLKVKKAICKCIPQLAKYFPEKAKQYMTTHFTTLRNDKIEKNLIAQAYICAGLTKSLGMQYVQEI